MLSFSLKVTGGSSGIGKGIAIECFKQGAFITLLARNEVNDKHAYLTIMVPSRY